MPGFDQIAAATLSRSFGDNPNRGKRKASKPANTPRLSASTRERTASGEIVRSGVTVVRVDPSYLKRYGSAAAVKRADANRRTGATTGGATLLGRNATRRQVRTLTKS